MSAATAVLAALAGRGVPTRRLCLDSRVLRPGDIFVALNGHRADGRAYIGQAVAAGAVAVLYEAAAGETIAALPVPGLAVPDLAAQVGEIAHLVYGRPSEHLWLAGVTGTNGKTSVSQWITQGMNALGTKCAVIGTLGNGFPGELVASDNTTPDAITLHGQLAAFVARGAKACAIEVSSIGLDQGRVNGVAFDIAVFTNLTRDHLEYHHSMTAYGAAKARLFDMPNLSAAVINLDDEFGATLAARLSGRVPTVGYTLEGRRGADEVLAAENLAMTPTGLGFSLAGTALTAPLLGRFNAANLLAVIGALRAAGHDLAAIAPVLGGLVAPPGRMERVGGQGHNGEPLVVVDYAHTPDALTKALTCLRETATVRGGKLICVFGCGGERDPGKRPLMGAVAESLADAVILTSDNPRHEAPEAILAAIGAGMKGHPAVEPNRAAAIRAAVASAAVNDTILLAGKGHETYQEVAGCRHPFSDIDEARAALEARR